MASPSALATIQVGQNSESGRSSSLQTITLPDLNKESATAKTEQLDSASNGHLILWKIENNEEKMKNIEQLTDEEEGQELHLSNTDLNEETTVA